MKRWEALPFGLGKIKGKNIVAAYLKEKKPVVSQNQYKFKTNNPKFRIIKVNPIITINEINTAKLKENTTDN